MPKTFIVIIALITGLIFFAGSATAAARASTSGASKRSSWKKSPAKKNQGGRVNKKTAGWRKSGMTEKAPKATTSYQCRH